jgi:hypothetical protein
MLAPRNSSRVGNGSFTIKTSADDINTACKHPTLINARTALEMIDFV